MEQATVPLLVKRRDYTQLEKRVDEYLKTEGWDAFLKHMQFSGSQGKSRDALVHLLQLEAVGGTDTDLFDEFSDLEGDTLNEIQLDAIPRIMEILKEQISEKHTYFIDVEAMAETPYAILAGDVIEARQRELAELDKNPSRIDVLGTFYGFTILMIDGSKPRETDQSTGYGWRQWRRRTWLDENITESAAHAVKNLTGQFAEEVDMDKRYRTLGSSPIFKSRCMRDTATILADAVRLAMYKVPGNRAGAARSLGRTEDSRALPFLHHRFPLEQSRKVRLRIAEALGQIGHMSSIDTLKDQINPSLRRLSKDTQAAITSIGGIFSPESKEALLEIVKEGGNTVKATAIEALGHQDPTGLVEVIRPCLEHKSRPVVRASVMALSNLGPEGYTAILTKVPIILKRIGNDGPSREAIISLLKTPDVSHMRSVHEFFATRIFQLRKEVERWKQYEQRGTYSYWYRRRLQRVTATLKDTINLVNRYLKAPFNIELVNSVQAAVKVYAGDTNMLLHLGQSELAQAIIDKHPNLTNRSRHEQTYFA